MKIYAIVNQKGGVGKTMTSVNFSIGLARQGKKVLAIDLDPQGDLTLSLGYESPDEMTETISKVFEHFICDDETCLDNIFLHHEENIDVIPSNIDLSGIDISLVNTMSRETILKQFVATIENNYDYVVIDCSPSLGMLTINALACADEVIIPVQPQYLSLRGMEQLFKTVNNVRKKINTKLKIGGILITMADKRTNLTKEIIDIIHSNYNSKLRVFTSPIPISVRASETTAEGKSIFLHEPNGKVAIAYENMVKEVLNEV
ncbi:MAG: ParA family protein [Clostridia bacterium]